MAFIEKKDPVVLNIKLTSKGRELLSKGELNFKYFAIGDSEIDYEFNSIANFNPIYSNILRPVDKNPQQLSFVTRNLSGDPYNEISNVPSIPTVIENQIQSIGFFENDNITFLTDSDYVKQPDAMVKISGLTGGTYLNLYQAPTYQANVNEPEEGDLILVKWTNPNSVNTTGYTINVQEPTPYLFYKIKQIISGTLNNSNLIIEVDRELPDYTNVSGGSDNVVAGAMIYNNYIDYTGDTNYSTDNADDALISFLQNCQCPTIKFPYWNLSIIFTENVVGVKLNDKQFGEYNTNVLGGFVSYIQNQLPIYRKLGVIHYTNNSVANTYAEGFFGDPLNNSDVNKIPRITIPTIMWHKSQEIKMGLTLKATGSLKYLTEETNPEIDENQIIGLNTRYFDLADENGNVVGKVFYDLKIFLIEDQELLFAMSYKSNRSWTLPQHKVDINTNVTFGCPSADILFDVSGVSPTIIGGSDGKIIISNISGYLGDPTKGDLILEILSGDTGTTNATQVFFNQITGDTVITENDTINNFGLSAITYTIKLNDLKCVNSPDPKTITITEPTAQTPTSIYDIETTYSGSGLKPYFTVEAYNDNPTNIVLYTAENGNGAVGIPYGNGYATIASTGITQTELSGRTEGTNILEEWVEVPSALGLNISSLTFLEPYVIYVRDSGSGDTLSDTLKPENIKSQVWSYYVAVANPFNEPNNIILTINNTDGSVTVSDYLKTINSNINPIIGDIEISIYDSRNNGIPTNWIKVDNPESDRGGKPIKLYDPTNGDGDVVISIRERYGFIIIKEITTNIVEFR